ncbi:metal-dependent phosphohydrolase [Actinoplanes sp. NPDC049668]|uniref:metal-dependent phosphohydrolase n=1 Tax=unclassified Actinoplanes TaxID=2626549 RepID=UPI0033ACFFA7
MTVLSPPRHPLVDAALTEARAWCAGHLIEERPALRHAAAVAYEVVQHTPDASPEVVAAALLHDAPECAPDDLDLSNYLTETYGGRVAQLVIDLHAEHQSLDTPNPRISTGDVTLLMLSTADQAVAFRSNLHRAHTSGDMAGFFGAKTGMICLLGYFRRYQQAGVGVVPATLSADLASSLDQIDAAMAAFRTRT